MYLITLENLIFPCLVGLPAPLTLFVSQFEFESAVLALVFKY